MATIPIGNFGQAVARPAPMPTVPRGDPIGQAGERTALIGAKVVNDMAQQQALQQQQEAAEQKRKDDEIQHAAIRAKTITALTGTKDKLADLHDQITQGVLDGSVPKEKAESEYAAQSAKVLEGIGTDLPEAQRGIVQAELTGDAARLGNSVRKAVTQRDRQDVTSGISQTLEYLQRQYRADPAKATQQAMSMVDQLGPHSTLNPEQLAKLKQTWKEGTQFTAGYELVSAGRADRKMLDAAEKSITSGLPDIDPQKRATLLDRVAAYRLHLDQKAELAAARVQRESERRLKLAEAEFKTFQTMADKGTVLDQAYIDRVIKTTSGTPYQAGVRMLAQQARDAGGLAAQPLRTQQMLLDQVDAEIAQRGRSPQLDARREQIAKVLYGSRQDFERDGLRAGLERGVISSLQPLDLTKGFPATLAQLRDRTPQAERVGMWAGRVVSPMTAEEAAQLKTQLDVLAPKDRAGMLSALAETVGPAGAQAMAAQLDKHDKPLALALAAGAQRTTQGRTVAELILRGAQAIKDKGVKEDTASEFGLKAQLAKEVGDAIPGSARENVLAAARLIYLGKQAEGDTVGPDGAIRLAIGGTLVEHNGKRLPVPAGVDLGQALRSYPKNAIAGQTKDGMVYLDRGNGMSVDVFVSGLPGMALEPVGFGRYVVRAGGSLATNADHRPIVVEVGR